VSPPQEWGIRANEDHHRPAGAHRRCRRGGFVARRWACFRANHGGTARFAGPLPAHPRPDAGYQPIIDLIRSAVSSGADDDVRARRGRRGHRTCRCAPPRCGRQSHPRSAFHGLDTNQAAYDALHAAGVDIKWAPNDAIYHQKPSSSTTLSPPSVPETSPRSTTRPRPMPTFSPPAPATSPPSPPPSTPTSPTSTSQVSARSGIASAGVRSTSRPSSVPTRPARPPAYASVGVAGTDAVFSTSRVAPDDRLAGAQDATCPESPCCRPAYPIRPLTKPDSLVCRYLVVATKKCLPHSAHSQRCPTAVLLPGIIG